MLENVNSGPSRAPAAAVGRRQLLSAARPHLPYPGLRPFEAEEWMIFFGRETMVDDVIDRLARQHFVLIHGASGSGKSSLVRAGVLPKLARLHLRRGAPWLTCTMRPAGGPLWNLATELARFEGRADDLARIRDIVRMFNRRDATLSQVVSGMPALAGRQLCILVDQFEELFRFEFESSRDEAELFIDLLIGEIPREAAPEPDSGLETEPESEAAVEVPPSPAPQPGAVHLILTMRSEFLGDCARFDDFAEAINRTQYLVPRLSHPALLRAIRNPARLYGGEVTADLAERMIAEVRGRSDELPLLQHGLMVFWTMASRAGAQVKPVLESPLLDEVGGLAKLLSDHADGVMRAVAPDAEGEILVARLFRALTEVNEEGQATRRPQSFADLVAVCGVPPDRLLSVIDAFRAEGASFLTPYAPAPIGDKTVIDISHEALIRCWQPVGGWMRAEARSGELYEELKKQTIGFRRKRRGLLGGEALRDALAWLKEDAPTPAWARRYTSLNEPDDMFRATMAFVAKSRQRQRLGLGAMAGALCVVVGIAGYFGVGAFASYAYTRGDAFYFGHGEPQSYKQALVWYERAAGFGNSAAQDQVGLMFANGRGTPPDYNRAMALFRKAARQGVADAELQIGLLYARGHGVSHDNSQAMTHFRNADALGSANADVQIGLLYLDGEGDGGKPDPTDALTWFQKAVKQHSAVADYQIGLLYLKGKGVPPDRDMAMDYFVDASQGGVVDAQDQIGRLYVRSKKYNLAMLAFQLAANSGSADAEDQIGLLYLRGEGIPKSSAQALVFFRQAAAQGSADAAYHLGIRYLAGDGVPRDDRQALTLFQLGAARGSANAEERLGELYLNGSGVGRDYARAMTLFEQAAREGSTEAQVQIGLLYEKGEGVKPNDDRAMTLFEQATQQGLAADGDDRVGAAQQGLADAENEMGALYLKRGKLHQAHEAFLAAANDGSADAADQLGLLYLNGNDVQRDYPQAVVWFTQAATGGSTDAAYHLGYRYLNGEGVPRDDAKAMVWFRVAASGNADAEEQIGLLYLQGGGVPRDYHQALAWFQKSVKDGSADALDQIGLLYVNGKGVKQDYGRAMTLFQQAAHQGSASAEDQIGLLYLDGYGVPADDAAALVWFRRAAADGSADAAYHIGMRYLNGDTVPQDYGQAMHWFLKGDAGGSTNAQYEIGLLYLNGNGVKTDYGKAKFWFDKAVAEDGNADAADEIGLLYLDGNGVPVDNAQAIVWFTRAAKSGSSDAARHLGYRYLNGQGVAQDYGQAMVWFRQAAAGGNADAEEQIGLLYLNGDGMPRDYAQARTWFLKSANDGWADASDQLGLLDVNGQGVKQDYGQAMTLFQQAAHQGSADAEEQIGFLYLRGQGVKQDAAQALDWFRKAAADGSTDAETQIGLLYLKGAGSALAPSDADAVGWFMKAGGGSIAAVEDHIGLRYLNGQGVSPDDGQAMRWFKMAEEKGSEDAADQIGYLDVSGRIPLDPAAAHAAFQLALDLALGTLQGAQDDAGYANDVAWQQLLVGDAKDALDMANQAIGEAKGADGVLPTNKLWLLLNKADALMLLHQTDAARKLYLEYRNVQDDGNGNAWQNRRARRFREDPRGQR